MPIAPLESETRRQPDEFRQREFQELRATVRERGHVRAIVSAITFVSWAALLLNVFGRPFTPLALLPLLVLAAGFEIVFALHVGVERVGRYLFVFYEQPAQMPKWETAIAAFGKTDAARSTGGGALLVPMFVLATLLNMAMAWALFSGSAPGVPAAALLAGVAAAHGAFVARVFVAKARAGRQRALDTAAFSAIAADLRQTTHRESN